MSAARLRIVADERERKSGIPELLRRAGVALEVRTLPVGDYIVAPEAAVERKSLRDLVSSVFDGRLFDQCARLRENYELPVIVMEGGADEIAGVAENPLVFYGALSRVALGYRIPVIPTPDASHTAKLLASMCASGGARRGPFLKRIRKPSDLRAQQMAALSSLPGVGEKLAARMLERFGTPAGALAAPLADLARVEGLGAARARRIRRVLGTRAAAPAGRQGTLHGR